MLPGGQFPSCWHSPFDQEFDAGETGEGRATLAAASRCPGRSLVFIGHGVAVD